MNPSGSRSGKPITLPPPKSLAVIRIIWAALLIGPLLFMAVIILIVLPNAKRPLHPPPVALTWAAFAVPAMMIPVAFIVRRMLFTRSRTEAGIPVAAYSTGNIVFWASCEGCAFLGLVVAMLTGSLWPTIIPVAIALSLQAITFPLESNSSALNSAGIPPVDRG